MGLGKQLFSQCSALFGLQRWDLPMKKRCKLLPEERSLMQNSRFWAGPLFSYLKGRVPPGQEKLPNLDGKTPSKRKINRQNQEPLKETEGLQLIITLIHFSDHLDEQRIGSSQYRSSSLIYLWRKRAWGRSIFSDHVMTNVEELCDDLWSWWFGCPFRACQEGSE